MITIEIENENEVSVEDSNLHLLNFSSANVVKKITKNDNETQTTTISNEDGEAYLETVEGTKTYHIDITPDGLITKKTVNGSTTTSRIATLDDIGDAENDVIEGYLYNGAFYQDSQHTQLITGFTGKIYVDKLTNEQYRFENNLYIPLTPDLSGYQEKITSNNKLDSDLVDDSNSTNKFVTAEDKTNWNGKQDALSQTQTNAVNSGITSELVGQISTNQSNITSLQSTKQDNLTAGTNIQINNNEISATDTTYSAGNGLNLDGTKFSVDTTVIQEKLSQTQQAAVDSGIDSTKVGQIATNNTNIGNIQAVIPVEATSNNQLSDKASAVGSIELSINSSTYVVTLQAKNVNGENIGNAQTIDLPLESVVVSGSYDDNTKKVILTLQSGSTIEFSIADLVSGLQTEITSENKLSADLVEDGITNKVYTATEQTKLSGIEAGAEVNDVNSVNSKTGVVVLDADDISDTNTTNKFVTTSEKNSWSAKQDSINANNKLSSDFIDDTNATNKFVTSAEKSQITTNSNNISGIKDGTTIDSFGDVETALSGKQDTLTAGTNITIQNNVISAFGGTEVETLTDYEVQDAVWEVLYTTYTLTVSVTNGTYVGNTKIVAERPAEIVVTAGDGYSLPSTITVSGATYSYNSTIGVITLTDATGNTSVTVVCE